MTHTVVYDLLHALACSCMHAWACVYLHMSELYCGLVCSIQDEEGDTPMEASIVLSDTRKAISALKARIQVLRGIRDEHLLLARLEVAQSRVNDVQVLVPPNVAY